MLPDRVSNPGLLSYESAALPIALRSPAEWELSLFCGGGGGGREREGKGYFGVSLSSIYLYIPFLFFSFSFFICLKELLNPKQQAY